MVAPRKHAIVSVLTTLVAVVACTGPAVTPSVVSVTIVDGGRSVMVGSTLALTATVVTVGGAPEAVLWSSDEPETATVSSAGVIVGVSPGEARISASSALDASKADTVTITVTSPPAAPAILGVTIDQTSPTVRVGDTLLLTASVEAVGGASSAVTWSSSDPSVATIHATTGDVTGNAGGITTISATSTYDASVRGMVILTVPAPMILTVDTNPRSLQWSTNTSVSLPLGGAVDINIDWGDGTWTRATTAGSQTHTYAASGAYTVRIAGTLDQLGFSWSWSNFITGVTAWGDLGLISLSGAFREARIRALPATLPPTVTDTSYMFEDAWLTADLSTWDVSNVTNMSGMFSLPEGSDGINPDIGSWDVSNVTNMGGMFQGNHDFNRDIGGWDVSSVTNMSHMFYYSRFNLDISGWDVSKVTNMAGMFGADGYYGSSPFNQDIGQWDVSNVTNMEGMFKDNLVFNRDIGDWDVSKVTTMRLMFGTEDYLDYGAFDQDISRWDVSNVTDMDQMFAWSPFNQDIGGWNVANVMRMAEMFSMASAFNQNLADWCVVNIPAEPRGFATGADAWILPKPFWGTCPGG